MLDSIATRFYLIAERFAGPRTANALIGLLGREVEPCSAKCGWCRNQCVQGTCSH